MMAMSGYQRDIEHGDKEQYRCIVHMKDGEPRVIEIKVPKGLQVPISKVYVVAPDNLKIEWFGSGGSSVLVILLERDNIGE